MENSNSQSPSSIDPRYKTFSVDVEYFPCVVCLRNTNTRTKNTDLLSQSKTQNQIQDKEQIETVDLVDSDSSTSDSDSENEPDIDGVSVSKSKANDNNNGNDNEASLLKLLRINIHSSNSSHKNSKTKTSNSTCRNMTKDSDDDDADYNSDDKYFESSTSEADKKDERNVSNRNRNRKPLSWTWSSIQSQTYSDAKLYCDACIVRNTKILRIYSKIEMLHRKLASLKFSVSAEFKRGYGPDEKKISKSVLQESKSKPSRSRSKKGEKNFNSGKVDNVKVKGQRWHLLREQFAKCFSLIPDVSPKPSQQNHNNDTAIEIDDDDGNFDALSLSNSPPNSPHSNFEESVTSINSSSTAKHCEVQENQSQPRINRLLNIQLKKRYHLKNCVISVPKLSPSILPNVPVLISASGAYLNSIQAKPDKLIFESKLVGVMPGATTSNNQNQNQSGTSSHMASASVSTSKHRARPKKKVSEELAYKGPYFFCDVVRCGRRKHKTLEELEIHRKQAHNDGTDPFPFKCTEDQEKCSKKFRKYRKYQAHINATHLKNLTLMCDFCGKGFAFIDYLRAHLLTHTSERPFKCPECPMTFKLQKSLDSHKRYIHLNDRRFICHFCGKAFCFEGKLKNHIKCIHKSERPHVCDLCGKSFPIHSYLYMHKRNVHKIPKKTATNESKDIVYDPGNDPVLDQGHPGPADNVNNVNVCSNIANLNQHIDTNYIVPTSHPYPPENHSVFGSFNLSQLLL